ncbi:hypothetical protein G9G63_14630 [Paenibacillus sp. EKM202P]|uniref:hypothetical protein n=1 Tax=Paenibacillus TaxID=44249 RepID=UPI0007EAE175|nr:MULTISPECIES: hypothetical protein [Paenibacillus]KAF6563423.1 hypothetical protein G9G63_14630 [Paenibacillus sp. EKM202P]KAF6569981.1 hypothetical protein G9G64_10245 [Paenibacillus sp. EKM207P]OAZ42743.1 hypothetical protein A9Z39_22590 [Paenibacillus polymyxa]
MIDLTSDAQFATLLQNSALPNECLTFIHDYMQQLRCAFENEVCPPPGQWFFILENADQLIPILHDQTAFSCSAGTYYPEYIERYTFDNGHTFYKIYVMLDNECSMTFFTLQGIHSTEAEQWLLANADQAY